MRTYPGHELRVTETLNRYYLHNYPYRVARWVKVHGQYDRMETLGYYRTHIEAEQAQERFTEKEVNMSRRAKQATRERFEDLLFQTERDQGMSGVYALAQALAAQLTEAQLLAVMREAESEE